MVELFEQWLQLFDRSFVFFSKLKEHFGVSNVRFKLFLSLYFLLQTTAILELLLGGFLIVPEIRRGGLRFDLLQLLATCRHIKETSRAGSLAREGCQTKYVIPGVIEYPS